MTYVPLTAPWVGLLLIGAILLVAAVDVVTIVLRRGGAEFPGGRGRLAWAIAIHAVGIVAIIGLVLMFPMSLLYAAGAALKLPEWAGYLFSFFGAGAGVWVWMSLARTVTRKLASPLLADREAFLGTAAAREEVKS